MGNTLGLWSHNNGVRQTLLVAIVEELAQRLSFESIERSGDLGYPGRDEGDGSKNGGIDKLHVDPFKI